MNNTTQPCLSKDELRDYTLGRLPESKLETVASHLETCITCEDTISSLEDTADSLVDYLQLLSTDHQVRGLYEKVSEISMALKQIAKTHDVSVMALAQLSRQVEQRENKRPQLSDLRDSGQIEQDADAVFFLLRDHYYHMLEKPEEHHPDFETWKDREEDSRHAIDFICAKRRNGLTGSARGAFYGQFQAVRGAI